jgi:biopolymer transport protein TolR
MAAPLFGRVSGRAKGRYRPLAEINVTPLVDVMLVLLIVFMVTAPLMTSGVPVDLPKTSAAPLNQDSDPLTVSVNSEGKIYLQDTEATLPELVSKLQAISDNKSDRRIFVRGDKGIAYGRVLEVMATITQGGFTKVALLAEQTAAPPATNPQAVPQTGSQSGTAPQPGAPTNRRQGRG